MEANRKLNVLFLEDNPDDVELELYELRKGGFDISYDVARNRAEFFEKLSTADIDIIIADYNLPDFTGIEAIHACRGLEIDVPVILITGIGNEQVAVDSLREGATDYILKKNITGFAARVERALDIWTDHQAMKSVMVEKTRLQHQLFQAQKMDTVGRLAGGIAHDFNNMLTGIMGYASLGLKKTPDDSPLRKNLESIIDVSRRAADLVKQLLLFSRKIPLELTLVNPNTLIEKNVEFLRRVVEETIDIQLVLQPGLPEIVSDEGQLTQILINFAVNARDAMESKGVLVIETGRHTRADLDKFDPSLLLEDEEYVSLSFKDTGCGIPAEEIPNIFDPFYTTKEIGKGTGLGLAIVYSIVSSHKGWLDVASRPGKGTTFCVYLPVRRKGDRVATKSSEVKTASKSWPREAATILIAEDEEILRDFSVEMLKSVGYRVLAAGDGEEAAEIYRKWHQDIDLVISDMVMPRKSGFELYEEILEINPAVKFILVTGYCLDGVQESVLQGMAALLMKPYSMEQITGLIRGVLAE